MVAQQKEKEEKERIRREEEERKRLEEQRRREEEERKIREEQERRRAEEEARKKIGNYFHKIESREPPFLLLNRPFVSLFKLSSVDFLNRTATLDFF
jgi:hypothetical protein